MGPERRANPVGAAGIPVGKRALLGGLTETLSLGVAAVAGVGIAIITGGTGGGIAASVLGVLCRIKSESSNKMRCRN